MSEDNPLPPGLFSVVASSLGIFHIMWAAFELCIDCALAEELGVPDDAAGAVATLEFGRKADLLERMIQRGARPEKDRILRLLRDARKSKRNIFAHSYISTGDDYTVQFIERRGGKRHSFGLDEFNAHVQGFCITVPQLQQALGLSDSRLDAFAAVSPSGA